MLVGRAFMILIALCLLAYAFLLCRDPSLLYRTDWFSRQMWGWLEGREQELRRMALMGAAAAVIGAGATIYLALIVR